MPLRQQRSYLPHVGDVHEKQVHRCEIYTSKEEGAHISQCPTPRQDPNGRERDMQDKSEQDYQAMNRVTMHNRISKYHNTHLSIL